MKPNSGRFKKGEHRSKDTEFKKGIVPYMNGKHHSEISKTKISQKLIGKPSWNKGKSLTETHKKKLRKPKSQISRHLMSIAKTGKSLSEEHRLHIKEAAHRGSENHRWKGGTTVLCVIIRTSPQGREWTRKVFERDNFTCQDCGERGNVIQAHHKIPFSEIIESYKITSFEIALKANLLWDIQNGVTLCVKCHRKRHGMGD